MMHTYVVCYLIGCIVGSVGVFVYSERLEALGTSVWLRASLSVVAGSLWPVLLVGLAQLGLITVYARLARRVDPPAVDHPERLVARLGDR